jgi:hypothetical protein
MRVLTLIGTGERVILGIESNIFGPNQHPDAPDVYHTTLFSDDEIEGLGSWGDPDNDNQISTGGFKNLQLAYPVPHRIRRNFLLQPFLTIPVFDIKDGPVVDPELLINTTFTYEAVDALVNLHVGDYIHFQGAFEAVPFPHPGPHYILGGEMAGGCPFGLTAPTCIGGPKWSSNGELERSRPCAYNTHSMVLVSTQIPRSSFTTRFVLSLISTDRG